MHEYKITDISKKKDEKKLVEIVKSLIPEPIPGKDGKEWTKEELLVIILPLIPEAPKTASKAELKKMIAGYIESNKETPPTLDFSMKEDEKGTIITINGVEHVIPRAVYGPKLRNFNQLGDVPGTYVGKSGKSLRVASNENGLEYYTPTDTAAVWGQITGTLSDQTDLQTALNAKVNKAGDTMTGDLIVPDEVYGAGWNGSLEVPTKNAVYDKIETLGGGAAIGGAITSGTAGSVLFVNPDAVLAQDNQNFNFNESTDRLAVSSTLGSELITNGTFTGNATGWTVPTGYAYSANTVVHGTNGTGALTPSTALTTVIIGQEFVYSATISAWTVGTVTLAVGGLSLAISANGTYTGRFIATTEANLTLTPTSTARFTVDNISLKRLSGGIVSSGAINGNTITANQSGGGATPVIGFSAVNTKNTTVSAPSQVSPSYYRKANGFFSNSQTPFPFEVRDYASGANSTAPYGKHIWEYNANSNGWNEFMAFDSFPSGKGLSITPGQSLSNGSPGTTRTITINNTGTNTWIDFLFSGVAKSHIGADSGGALKFYAGGGSYFEYYQMSGSLFSYNFPTAFVHYADGRFGGKVIAGSQIAPTSTLQTKGSLALEVKRITASQTLDGTATHWLCDATTAAACSGTPSVTTCSSYTASGQATCESHLPCVWNAGSACSAFDSEYGMGTCSGTSGCTVVTNSCAGPGDQTTCESQDDSWGGSCFWGATGDCSPFDEATCGSYSGQCTVNMTACVWDGGTNDCSGNAACDAGDNTDQATCEAITYFTSCSGNYYACSGDYNTGSCTGMYGTSCSGTATCVGYGSSGPCAAEAGCTWSSVLNATMPSMASFPHRTYWIYNDSSGGADIIIYPEVGATINGTTSLTLANYKDGVHVAPYHDLRYCSDFVSAGTCTPDGCSVINSNCSWNSMDSICSGNVACDGIGDQGTCEGTTYFSGCSGQYTVSRDWKVWSRT